MYHKNGLLHIMYRARQQVASLKNSANFF